MRGSLLFTLFYLFVTAWAGGYQGCLERVWLYQAYLIDSLNDYDDQTIGWQCKGRDFNKATKTCTKWVRMPGSKKGQTLSYDQFIFALGGAKDRTGWSVMSGGKLDVKATALNTYKKYLTPGPGQAAGSAKVKNFGAQLAVKDAFEWNQCIMKVGEVVDKTYKDKSSSMDDAAKKLFENFDATRDLVINARTGDHGPFLIEQARKKLSGMDINIEVMGKNPVDGDKNWETVDWAETERAAREGGDKDAGTKITNFLKEWYGNTADGDSHAREHRHVIESYKRVRDQQVACGRK